MLVGLAFVGRLVLDEATCVGPAAAGAVGASLAKKAVAAGIKQVVFDRGGCKYHGRVKALAEAAREDGLEF